MLIIVLVSNSAIPLIHAAEIIIITELIDIGLIIITRIRRLIRIRQ